MIAILWSVTLVIWKIPKVGLTPTATGDFNFLAGDSIDLINSLGGADSLTATGDFNFLVGDSSQGEMENSLGGARYNNCNR